MQGKILIVDDLATNRIILKVKLNAAFHETVLAASGAEGLMRAQADLPKLILLDLVLPDMSGIDVCRKLRANPLTKHIPIVIITASNDRESRLKALEAGADEFLTKPLNEVILLARIRSLLRAHQTEAELTLRNQTWGEFDLAEEVQGFESQGTVGLIGPDTPTSMAWMAALKPHLSAQMVVLSPQAALSSAGSGASPDCYLIAANLGHGHDAGLRLVADLRSRDASRHAAIALALADPDPARAAIALDLGASDLLTMPWDPEETALRLRLHVARKQRADRLRDAVNTGLRLAIVDPLTGLYNRRFGMAHLERVAEQACTEGRRFAVMVIDLDRFKQVNDRHGHSAGDKVLVSVAKTLRASLRPSDTLARIGGEEFLVLLPDANPSIARAIAERLCRAVASRAIPLEDGQTPIHVTVSVGLALGPSPLLDPGTHVAAIARHTFDEADQALYSCKAQGRNQVKAATAA